MAVLCANGRVGTLVIKEAMARGLDVTAVVQGDNKTDAQKVVRKCLFALTAVDLADFDVVVDAFGAWALEILKHLCDILSGTDTRLLVVGGAGSLHANTENTVQMDFHVEFLPLAEAQNQALAELRNRSDVKWTFVSPAGDVQSEGESIIGCVGYVSAVVDEITKGNHIQQRVSVVRK